MSDIDEFLAVDRELADAKKPRRSHPRGWEPGIDTAAGTLIVEGGEQPPADWSRIIQELGLDSDVYVVDDSHPVQVRSWDSGDKRCYYYKATVRHRSPTIDRDIDDLVSKIIKHRSKRPVVVGADRSLVVALADWQLGKGVGTGDELEQMIQRLLDLKDAVPGRVRELARIGRPISQIVVAGLGDIVESCDGHYAMQQWQTQLDNREQQRLARRMLVELITAWSRSAPDMIVTCVPGNHGQRRKDGKAFTTWGDNADVEAFEVAREILAANQEAYGHIRWIVPDQEQTVTVDASGFIVGFAHGHQFRGGSGSQGKALAWWRNMAMNRSAIGDADCLVSGHFHHFQVHCEGVADSKLGRTWMQAPALDPGSPWWEHQGGAPTQQGTLTFACNQDGWTDVAIL